MMIWGIAKDAEENLIVKLFAKSAATQKNGLGILRGIKTK